MTTDIPNRINRHNSGKGAKYTRSHRPVKLIYFEKYETESEARRRERELKGWRREKKEKLISGFPSERLIDVLRISGQ
ncbi:MAG: GIY-YIG nuclease family protein [Candidatus Zixiibacteriota bacterium]